ncbi:AcrR family transcriptional regulator [Streptomyces aurantiacus]|uniref:TetR/AcrR family transcriptional regulator n=1 Tax=Streptomyces aurantiacus TaxID=47760 RepID=UPI0027905291|nr:TetR/AcrR family transcriptional regulator [Streptomyces aurantiacus]MDQ0777175.1 AcrR family transcriptional regulator [Streptomyces aurantiacus]
MMLNEQESVRHRRRGAALEAVLLDAAWAELTEHGYDAFTFDAVAVRADTSRAVLYRRWATKQELVLAAIGHGAARVPLEIPDTGSVRGDMLALLRYANATRVSTAIILSLHLGGYFTDTGSSLDDLRTVLRGDFPDAVRTVMDRGVQRGELDPGRLSDRIERLPFDLYRYELMMTAKPVPEDVLQEIVDTVFLPLVSPLQGGTA